MPGEEESAPSRASMSVPPPSLPSRGQTAAKLTRATQVQGIIQAKQSLPIIHLSPPQTFTGHRLYTHEPCKSQDAISKT